MQVHNRCPHCDGEGMPIDAQDTEAAACMNEACRVISFGRYYG